MKTSAILIFMVLQLGFQASCFAMDGKPASNPANLEYQYFDGYGGGDGHNILGIGPIVGACGAAKANAKKDAESQALAAGYGNCDVISYDQDEDNSIDDAFGAEIICYYSARLQCSRPAPATPVVPAIPAASTTPTTPVAPVAAPACQTPQENVATVTNGHYLIDSSCPIESGVDGFVGAGSSVRILDEAPENIYNGVEARHVVVINNTDTNVLAAPTGCSGWAISGYLSDLQKTDVTTSE